MGSDEATAITNELYRYAELVDAGRFDEVGELMEHCTFSYGDDADGPPERRPSRTCTGTR